MVSGDGTQAFSIVPQAIQIVYISRILFINIHKDGTEALFC